jgi:uncharacterized membrane protein (DUF2068 family)
VARREIGLRLIILYKLVKGVLALVGAVALILGVKAGLGHKLDEVAEQLRHHARAWSLALADAIMRAATNLQVVAAALALDGAFTLFEGVGLARGWWWAPWLVVIGTGSFLPLEVVALVRHATIGRALLLVVNGAIVVYLARRLWRERRG